MRSPYLFGSIVVASMTLAAPHHACADEADDAFKSGTSYAEAGNAPLAEQAFEKAWALRKAWDIAGNLGLSEAAQSKWEEAALHLDYAVSHIGSLASADQKAGLKARYDEVTARVARVTIETASRGMTVKVGARSGFADEPYFLLPGRHTFVFEAAGYETKSLDITAAEGKTQRLKIDLAPRAIAPDPKSPPGAAKPVWPAVLLGTAGGVFALGGAGLLVGAFVTQSDAEDQAVDGACTPGAPICQEVAQGLDKANTLGALGFVGIGLGAVSLGGLVLVLALPSDNRATAPMSVRVEPTGLVLEGRF